MKRRWAPTGGAGPPREPSARVATTKVGVLAIALCLVTVVLVIFAKDPLRPLYHGGPLAPILVTAGFFLAERFVFTVEYRRQGVNISLSEVPAAFALLFLPPWVAVLARVAGSLLARAGQPNTSGIKPVFNSAMFGTEVALSAWLVRSLTDGTSPLEVLLCGAAAICLSSLVGGSMVSVAIAAFEGGLLGRLRFELGQGLPVYVLGALLGVTAVAPALLDRWLFLLPLLPCILVWRLLVSRGHLTQRHRDLTELHAFTGAVSSSLDLPEVVEAAQVEGRRLLRAESAALLVFDPATGAVVHRSSTATGTFALPSSSWDARWSLVLDSDEPVRLNANDTKLPAALLSDLGWTEALTVPVRDAQGLLGVLIVADRAGALKRFSNDDLTRMKPLAEQLAVSLRKGLLHVRMEREATHDRLTGLPNRALFERLVEESLEQGRTAVFLLDLDRFKEVNDGLGHHVGDMLLQQFASRVTESLGPDDVLSRLAGDEFAVLSRGASDHEAIRIGMEIIERGRHTFDLGELSVAVSCSIGLAIGPGDGRDPATLLRRADLAMYKAKGRSSGLEIYSQDLDSSSAERLELLRDLRQVLDNGQLDVHFQPKIDLHTNKVIGAEALVRWHHPTRGLLDAEMFIGLVEQTDLIHSLTDHVLSRALKAARGWRARGWALEVAVNVSARTLLDELLVDRVSRHLATNSIDPGMLTIEITETSVMADVSRALGTLTRLDDLGVRLSVDDFGTGYSSLTYLRRLPVSELKIDRAFVAGMLTDKHDHIIVRSTVDLGRHLGLRVVAEGVENELVGRRLRDMGCDVGQGLGYSKPLPLVEFNAWVTAHQQLSPVPGTDELGSRRAASA